MKMRNLLSKKKLLWYKYKSSRNSEDLRRYKEVNSLFKLESNHSRMIEEETLIKSNDPSKFFKFVNNRLKNHKTAPFITNNNGVIVYDDKEKAELFNRFFSSVFTIDDGSLPYLGQKTDDRLSNIVFTEDIVVKTEEYENILLM